MRPCFFSARGKYQLIRGTFNQWLYIKPRTTQKQIWRIAGALPFQHSWETDRFMPLLLNQCAQYGGSHAMPQVPLFVRRKRCIREVKVITLWKEPTVTYNFETRSPFILIVERIIKKDQHNWNPFKKIKYICELYLKGWLEIVQPWSDNNNNNDICKESTNLIFCE